MTLLISNVFTYDEDAGNYIQAVETADTQALEPATRKAINNFVIGCKQDGIWTAIKASCILAGARTRLGALTPLVGTAPTSFNFVDGDYNRKTGLVGDGSTKYLDSNRNNNVDPQNSKHVSAHVSTFPTSAQFARIIGCGASGAITDISRNASNTAVSIQSNSTSNLSITNTGRSGFYGTSRTNSTNVDYRIGGVAGSTSLASSTPLSESIGLYGRSGTSSLYSNGRYTFYSIGESLDLARLDARVTDLINAFAVTIP